MTDKLERNAAAIKRWRTRLKRAMTMLDKLEKQRKRLEAKSKVVEQPPLAPPPRLVDTPETVMHQLAKEAKADPVIMRVMADDDLAIPTFLQRKKLDPAAEQIKSEQAETKKKKAQGRIAKLKAKQSGATKRMPLSGKAALEAIRNG